VLKTDADGADADASPAFGLFHCPRGDCRVFTSHLLGFRYTVYIDGKRSTGMDYEDGFGEEHDDADVDPAKLSLVGGFVGTVSGLKRGGPGGALIGGLVGGTAGYVTGAALSGTTGSEYDHGDGHDSADGPITIDVDEEGAEGDDGDGSDDGDAGDGADGRDGDGGEAGESGGADAGDGQGTDG
jgi:hypothetical protein